MAFQSISVGASANDGTGDTPRAAFIKVNQNFSAVAGQLASALQADTALTATGGTDSRTLADWLAYFEDLMAAKFTPTQTYVAVPAYSSSTPATIVQVLPANANRRHLKIVNNGTVDVELWYGSSPAANKIGQTPRQGEVAFANGGGADWDAVPISAVYATASAATGLSVIEG